ncbi:Sel1-like repeat family protein [Skeletonema marinoi]|uniref:Sel1-like repeat family protein n=1 Tax=Skeletonema marinoi TaxID=267567 RepID=A0AAD8YL13_9STRA|nr:Sel1-like repeat family protein [Skeletonema marinoi]
MQHTFWDAWGGVIVEQLTDAIDCMGKVASSNMYLSSPVSVLSSKTSSIYLLPNGASYFKVICNGCNIANVSREYKQKLNIRCPFCRHLYRESEEENERRRKKRFEANDPFALRERGRKHFDDRDYERAFEYFTKAADFGDVEAQFNLSLMYREGLGVEKDEKMELYYEEEAAISGDPSSRYSLGCHEGGNGRYDRAVKHWIIAAKLGHDDSVQRLKGMYKSGYVSKEEFASALRGHQAAVDATKSPQRELAGKILSTICKGCTTAHIMRHLDEGSPNGCPFCRQLYAKSDEELKERRKKRFEANDPFALREAGRKHFFDGGYKRAFEYLAKAADLGDAQSQYFLSLMYRGGLGVEKDVKMELYYLEEAAIGGDPTARHKLGCKEGENGRYYRAVKHWIIAANLGYDESLERLKEFYKSGYVSKEDFASALRGHQAAIDATKSPQREEAEKLLTPKKEAGMKHFGDGDYDRAFEYFTKAADFGDLPAQFILSLIYREGLGVEKDEKMELYYSEEAAISGDPIARCSLGCKEGENGRYDRAVKHFIIAAKLGHDDSLQRLKEMYKSGYVSKEDFASALRGHQAAVDATKSPQREEADKLVPTS